MDKELPLGVVRLVCDRATLPLEMLDTLALDGRLLERTLLPLVLLLLALRSTAKYSEVKISEGLFFNPLQLPGYATRTQWNFNQRSRSILGRQQQNI